VKQVIKAALTEQPFTTMRDLASILETSCSLKVSRSTASRWTRGSGFTHKKAYKAVAVQHDPVDVMRFCNLHMFCRDNIVCIDEMAFYVGERPRRGYAPRGQRLNVPSARGLRHRKYTVIMAVSRNGVVAFDVLEHNCNATAFATFVRSLPCGPGTSLLMDNVAFHKSPQVKDAYRTHSFHPLFIPPYSPRVNAIENVFSVLKARFRASCPLQDAASFDYRAAFVRQASSLGHLHAFFDRVDGIVDAAFMAGGEGFVGVD
jgi:transposase